ncbi:MAG TPA: PP2C family protein-serine/threonine phosphatase, partial [Salinivirgaceae bacterium]|nr:PP2C family protein-serine/threonine phosphatase [Salinivirgaceae bacterium]
AADCTGHGVPGAFMSMLGITFLNELVNKDGIFETDEILNRLRTNIIRSLKQTGEDYSSKDGMNISICAINHTTLTAHFSGAYQPLIIIKNGEIIEYKADKMPIGYHLRKNDMFTYQEIQLQLGDRLYMYSDGYIDQFGGKNDRRFTSRRLREVLSKMQNLSMQEQKIHLTKTLKTWMEGHEQVDDILVFGIEITDNFVSKEVPLQYAK